jgi:hypothetical protein
MGPGPCLGARTSSGMDADSDLASGVSPFVMHLTTTKFGLNVLWLISCILLPVASYLPVDIATSCST